MARAEEEKKGKEREVDGEGGGGKEGERKGDGREFGFTGPNSEATISAKTLMCSWVPRLLHLSFLDLLRRKNSEYPNVFCCVCFQ